MPINMVRDDITRVKADAIVTAAGEAPSAEGGVNGRIHRAAGPELLAERRKLGLLKPGEARATRAFRLPCRYVIHTVGPLWQGGGQGEEAVLAACYRRSLELALELGCRSAAFPLIAAGAHGYPRDRALRTALETVKGFVLEHDMAVTLVVFDRGSYQIGGTLFSNIAAYIDQQYVDRHTDSALERLRSQSAPPAAPPPPAPMAAPPPAPMAAPQAEGRAGKRPSLWTRPQGAGAHLVPGLSRALSRLDLGFSQTLLGLIDRKGMTDAQCYKKANLDRKLFSKIRGNPAYRPSKPTALAFAVALELSLEETEDLLRTAGFALSRSSKFDIIVEYFIVHGCYDIFAINEALFAFDQPLLGG